MKKLISFVILIVAIVLLFILFNSIAKTTLVSQNKNMKIASISFQNNTKIPSKYACDGDNVNPPLEFADVPKDAKSLVLIVDDPDALDGTFVHWVVYNIDPKTKEILENSVPKSAVLGMTDFGKPGYGGPCPPASPRGEPSGVHRYFFKLYAVNKVLSLISDAGKQAVEEDMKDNILDNAEIIGLYSKKQ